MKTIIEDALNKEVIVKCEVCSYPHDRMITVTFDKQTSPYKSNIMFFCCEACLLSFLKKEVKS